MVWKGIDSNQDVWFTTFDGVSWAPQMPGICPRWARADSPLVVEAEAPELEPAELVQGGHEGGADCARGGSDHLATAQDRKFDRVGVAAVGRGRRC
jgi:hypothetical protein